MKYKEVWNDDITTISVVPAGSGKIDFTQKIRIDVSNEPEKATFLLYNEDYSIFTEGRVSPKSRKVAYDIDESILYNYICQTLMEKAYESGLPYFSVSSDLAALLLSNVDWLSSNEKEKASLWYDEDSGRIYDLELLKTSWLDVFEKKYVEGAETEDTRDANDALAYTVREHLAPYQAYILINNMSHFIDSDKEDKDYGKVKFVGHPNKEAGLKFKGILPITRAHVKKEKKKYNSKITVI